MGERHRRHSCPQARLCFPAPKHSGSSPWGPATPRGAANTLGMAPDRWHGDIQQRDICVAPPRSYFHPQPVASSAVSRAARGQIWELDPSILLRSACKQPRHASSESPSPFLHGLSPRRLVMCVGDVGMSIHRGSARCRVAGTRSEPISSASLGLFCTHFPPAPSSASRDAETGPLAPFPTRSPNKLPTCPDSWVVKILPGPMFWLD